MIRMGVTLTLAAFAIALAGVSAPVNTTGWRASAKSAARRAMSLTPSPRRPSSLGRFAGASSPLAAVVEAARLRPASRPAWCAAARAHSR